MDEYVKCLTAINEKAKASDVADFEFSQPREAVIFSHWMGAILPVDESNMLRLPVEKEDPLPNTLNSIDDALALFGSIACVDANYLLERRYVQFIEPLTTVTTKKFLGKRLEFDRSAYSQIIGNIANKGLNPRSFILVELEKYPAYNEHFWQYIAGCYFRQQGYLVTRQAPDNLRGSGRPDMCAYKSPSALNPLIEHGIVKKGCFLIELELPMIFGEVAEQPRYLLSEQDCSSIVIETKSRGGDEKAAEDQLTYRSDKGGYLEDGHFDEGYIVGPNFKHIHKVGVISNTPDGKPSLFECKRKNYALTENKKEVLHKVEKLLKLVLLRNLPLNRLLWLCRNNPLGEITLKGFLDEVGSVIESMTVEDVSNIVYLADGFGVARQQCRSSALRANALRGSNC